MDHSSLKEDVRRLTLKFEIHAQLKEQGHLDQGSILLEEIRENFRKLTADIMTLPSEPDRNGLWDEIIKALQDVGMIASTVKAVVDLLQS